jgi:hypothetical protein
MKMKFHGNYKNLQGVMALTGIAGEWREGENHHQYRATNGAVLNWWKSTGTITFQGPESATNDLKDAFVAVRVANLNLYPTPWSRLLNPVERNLKK